MTERRKNVITNIIIVGLFAVALAIAYNFIEATRRIGGTPELTGIERAMLSTVKVQFLDTEGHGSGVVISDEGHIITNQHVCGNLDAYKIIRSDGLQVNAKVLWTTPKDYDLCLIKAEDRAIAKLHGTPGIELEWTPAIFATASPKYGDEVTVIGNPMELAFVMTRGIVSNPDQEVPYAESNRLQVDAVVGPGNSGGPVFNADYELIGIIHAGRAYKGALSGWNFAIPLSIVREVLAK